MALTGCTAWPGRKQTPLLFHLSISVQRDSLWETCSVQVSQDANPWGMLTLMQIYLLYANQQSAWFPLPGSQRLICKIKAEARVFQLPWLSEQGDVQLCNAPVGSSEEEKGLAPTCSRNEEQNRSFSSFYPTHTLRQCAAVMTHLLLMRVPPQMWV